MILAVAPLLGADLLDRVLGLVEVNRDLLHLYWQEVSSASHLAGAVLIFLGFFFVRHVRALRRIRRARKKMPLVIGGWGTRGKSGVERKKSALFAAYGAEVVTKTTGCEAMFIHAQPGVKPLEVFIYRPYDKASIWEQRDLFEMATDLHAHVFLYECMALNPQYVRIIQEVWMQDDLSTLTNTYPDHEDIQGPAGVDLPYVMGNFIPPGKTCLTAEETMLPILEACARRKGAQIVPIRWREAALIPEDVLARYPYNVHPLNLALVTRMAEHLGIERDFCWKEVADNIIPDLGVLKVYPEARHRGRRLEFSNGHSANERHGFNANWERLDLARFDPVEMPDRWLVTMVNNRGDRISRSKVFADCLTQDVSAHGHFLVGTNLNGLQGYMMKALETRLRNARISVGDEGERLTPVASVERYDRELRAFMVEAPDVDGVLQKLRFMLGGLEVAPEVVGELVDSAELRAAIERSPLRATDLDPLLAAVGAPERDPDLDRVLLGVERRLREEGLDGELAEEVRRWTERYVRDHKTLAAFRRHVEAVAGGSSEARAELDVRFQELLRRAFLRKLLPIHDAHVTGDQIVDFVARHTPPGFRVHVHGCQNIKGPGLDWVYRWVNLDLVERAIQSLKSSRGTGRLDALVWLSTTNDYGVLDAPRALEAVRAARADPRNQDMAFQTQANLAIEHLERHLARIHEAIAQAEAERGLMARLVGPVVEWCLAVVEKVLDAGDSKWRRRAADRIRDDLVAERIGHDRAATELRAIVKRQKGGWLQKAAAKRLRAFRASLGLPDRAAQTVTAQGDRD